MNVISPENRPLITHFANMPLDDVFNRIKEDVVPVVRCKDCKYSSFIKSCSKYECQKGCGALKFSNDYCSYGERKD